MTTLAINPDLYLRAPYRARSLSAPFTRLALPIGAPTLALGGGGSSTPTPIIDGGGLTGVVTPGDLP